METNTSAMNPKQESLAHLGICLLMILLSLGGLAYGVKAGLLLAPDAPFTLDGILLALVCLSILVTFAGLLANIAFREGWIGRKAPASTNADNKPTADSGKSA
jgi:hypothetical protein